MWISKKDFLRLNTRVLILEKKMEELLNMLCNEEESRDEKSDYSSKKPSMNESGLGKDW